MAGLLKNGVQLILLLGEYRVSSHCLLRTEMPTIPIFAESFRASRPISALRLRTSKFRKITILQAKMAPDKIKDIILTYTPVLRTFYVAVDYYTWTQVVNK